ncbi:MAG: hypothetical protein IPO04_05995 [Cytophagaceae bacterium]|nr:hypothetical protein [Cytophagaceae bacterium]
MLKIEKLRTFLEKNKIFVETITATCLAIMAIVVSIKANKIAEQQTNIAYQELLPKFHIVTKQTIDPKLNLYTGQSVQVFNYGNNFDNFYAEGFSFIELTFEDTLKQVTRVEKIRLLPVYSYQFASSDEQKGLIRELRTNDFYLDIDTLDFNFNKNKHLVKKWTLKEFQFKHYLKLSYLSIMKERKINYYDIDFMEGQLLEDEIGSKLWNQHHSDADRRGALTLHCNEQNVIEKLKLLNEQMNEK